MTRSCCKIYLYYGVVEDREAEELQPDRFNPGRSCPQVLIEVLFEREGGELLDIISLYMSFWYDLKGLMKRPLRGS